MKRWSELEAMLPDAAFEEHEETGEIVIYTGLMVGEDLGDDKTLVPWVDPEEASS